MPLTGLRGVAAVMAMLYHMVLYDAHFQRGLPNFFRRPAISASTSSLS